MLKKTPLRKGIHSIQKEDITALMNANGYIWLKKTGLDSPSDFHPHDHKFIDTPMQYTGGSASRQSVGGRLMPPQSLHK